MRTQLENNDIFDPIIKKGFKLGSMTIVPADNFPLPADAPPYVELNPAGAVDILMPTSNADRKGLCFLIANISGSTITLKTDGDAAFTTAIVLLTNEVTLVVCTGNSTQALGWRAVGTASSA
jgi:hypothetical protein